MGMLFGKASGRTFKRFGKIIPCGNRNSLKVKSSDTNPFLIKSPSEALEGSISMGVFCNALTCWLKRDKNRPVWAISSDG